MKTKPEQKPEPKNCKCKEPIKIAQITQATDGHWFTFCKRCNKERRIELNELFS